MARESAPRRASILHIEGIPGSGKTTAAARLCDALRARGADAVWALEEAHDHPVMPKDLRRRSAELGFTDVCLDAWQRFIAQNRQVAVLDGYALQTTVRFLYANCRSRADIDDYFVKWQRIVSEASVLIRFNVDDVAAHYEEVSLERGADWTTKLVTYVAKTPLGRARRWTDIRGFIEFWARYQDLCRELVAGAVIPTMTMAARSWDGEAVERIAGWAELADEQTRP